MSDSYRRALPEDYPAILSLQSANYIANLSASERKQGFLSAQFSLEQTAQIAEDLGTMVAIVDSRVAAFLSSFGSYIYGPVCIDRNYRGRGLLRGLFEAQKKELAGQFEIGVAFVSRSNPHSLTAHVDGLGMAEVGDFECRGNIYATLVFRV